MLEAFALCPPVCSSYPRWKVLRRSSLDPVKCQPRLERQSHEDSSARNKSIHVAILLANLCATESALLKGHGLLGRGINGVTHRVQWSVILGRTRIRYI